MQEHAFVPKTGMTKDAFWREAGNLAISQKADEILAYMRLMLNKAAAAEIEVRRSDFAAFGRGLKLFRGVEDWFARIDAHGKARGAALEHYIGSSGNREIIEGTSIGDRFKAIFVSSFMYDHHDIACWP